MPMLEQIIDPVTGFQIPSTWIELCPDPQILQKIKSGRWVLLSNGLLLKRGLTTGTTAAAACKGAILSLKKPIDKVEIMTPVGIKVDLMVIAKDGACTAVKDGGDHEFDITKGLEIVAVAQPSEETALIAGKGVGCIMAKGLSLEIGRPAISPSARLQIMNSIKEGLRESGLRETRIELSIPRGSILAKETFNPRLGIIGGISILGSTGFVEPWNDHLTESRLDEMKNEKKIVVTTGRTGLKFSRILFPDHKAILIGSNLDQLTFEKDQESILCGLPALILKWACPQILDGTNFNTVAEMVEKNPNHKNISISIEKAKKKLPNTRIVLLLKDGNILREL
jgi:cobalt-precorrin-5B (C1)-methyltransferase